MIASKTFWIHPSPPKLKTSFIYVGNICYGWHINYLFNFNFCTLIYGKNLKIRYMLTQIAFPRKKKFVLF